ncbi:MAG: hypothetical protein JEY99_21635 [Spirochaetales bacterium]|nr:hypothetical protein [Spirochaetales bacterium]
MFASIGMGVERAGQENPQGHYEAPNLWMTLDNRERQLHDEDKSGGNQPAYIRVIDRRFMPSYSCSSARIQEDSY